jgi:hypothetical protein
VAGHDATLSRGGSPVYAVAKRFITHPWGRKEMAFPVLALAVAGIVALSRQRRSAALPLAVLTAFQLAVCLLIMDPADAVRYALPSMLGIAFAAAVGTQALARLVRAPAAAARLAPILVTLLIVAASIAYAWPVLAVRSRTLSPTISAARWARRNVPAKSVILAGEDMAPQADLLLKEGFDLKRIEDGFHHAACRPEAQAWIFAEGESRWPGAVTFRWPDSDPYHKLTRDHYRVISLSPISLDHRFKSVRGVYGWEPTFLDARWRWLDADAAIRIFPRKWVRAAVVKLGLDRSAPFPANTVTLSIDGGLGKTVEIARGTWQRVELPLPAHRMVEIGIRSAHSFVTMKDGAPRRAAVQLLAVERIAR